MSTKKHLKKQAKKKARDLVRRRRVATLTIRQDHWEPHETVTIKGFTEDDHQWVQDAAMLLKDKELRVLSGSSRMATLVRGIVSWTLTDENGRGMPWPALFDGRGNLIAENLAMRKTVIKSLMPEDAEFLYEEIGKLNQPMSKEEQETFLASARPGSSETLNQAHPHLMPLSISSSSDT